MVKSNNKHELFNAMAKSSTGERRTPFSKAYGIKVRWYGENVGENIGNPLGT